MQEREKGTHHTEKTVERGREGVGNCLDDELLHQTMLQIHANASNEEHMEFRRMHICKKLENVECSLLLTLLNCI